MTKLSCRRPAAVGLALALLTGCGLLDTEHPTSSIPVTPRRRTAPRLAASVHCPTWPSSSDGDGTDFVDGEILLTGLMADEFMLSTTPPGEQEIDQRKISTANLGLDSLFLLLQRGRAESEGAADALQRLLPDPDSDPGIAEMLAVAGYSYVSFGEDFCSGVPFSRVDGDTIIFGAPQTTEQIFGRASSGSTRRWPIPASGPEDVANLARSERPVRC